MSTTKIVALVVGLVCITFVLPVWNMRKERRETMTMQCWQIGRDLLAFTNSPSLSSLQPAVQERLAQFLTAPARIETVRLGDEPRPPGDPKADARLYLLNDRNERLGIRLQRESKAGKYRVVGYWIPSARPPADTR